MEVRTKNTPKTNAYTGTDSQLVQTFYDVYLYKAVVFSMQDPLSDLSCSLFSEPFPVDLNAGKAYLIFTPANTHILSFKTMSALMSYINIYINIYIYM